MKVLLVDDEMELVSALAERLSLRNIDADWVTSGDEALTKVETQTYDIAVLDIKMPKIGGLGLKKMLQEKCPGMKFIFLTGHGSESDFETAAADIGSAYYLVKPVKLETLMEKMAGALSEKEG